MGLMDKLKFWKKEPEFAPADIHPPSFPQQPDQSAPSFDQLGMPQPAQNINEPVFGQEQSSFPPSPPQSFQQQRDFQQQGFQSQSPQSFQQQGMSSDQQLQLINSKLDTIKAQLETVLQRLDRLERKEEQSPYQQRWRASI